MKKLLNGILASSLILSMGTVCFAEETTTFAGETAVYTETLSTNALDFEFSNGKITKYTGSDPHVVIPYSIGGQEVYSIGTSAFANNANLRTVTFAANSQVTELVGGNGYGSTRGAFYNCSNLQSVTLPNSLLIMGSYSFENCDSLTTVTGGENMKTIGSAAFSGCIALEKMDLYDKVTSIAANSYENCTDLYIYCNDKSYALDYALSSGIKYVRRNVSAAEQTFDATTYDFKFSDGTLTAYTGSDSNVEIPATLGGYEVYKIGTNAFASNATLRNVTFAHNSMVTELAGGNGYGSTRGPFYNCRNLQTVVLPDSLLTLGGNAFESCISLTNVTGGKTLKTVASTSFSGCISLAELQLFDKVTSIGGLTGYDDLVISCVDGSYALEYALKNGIPYKLISANTVTTQAPSTTPQVDTSMKTATPSDVKVMVNGTLVAFAPYAIDGFNYFKLTDMAYAIDGTGKQFEVTWDMEKSAINMVTGSAHRHLGNEMEGNSGKSEVAERFTSTVYKNGEAIEVLVYTINGSSYFQLDTLKGVLGIDVGWDGATGTITITA